MRCAVGLAALVAVLLGGALDAAAYVRTKTCSTSSRAQVPCEAGEAPLAIFWPSSCVIYHIHEAGSQDTNLQRTFDAITASFDRWNAPTCSYMSFEMGGFTDEDRVGYNPYTGSEGNANVLMFRDEVWEHDRGILALTSVTFRPSTGEILDADIEFNGVDYNFTTTNDAQRVVIDVANTVTHEAGHFLGLDHSTAPESTMYATAPIRETKKRTLDQDDVNGVCEIYPLDLAPASQLCMGAEVGFFERPEYGPEDGPPPQEARTCACATPAAPRLWPAAPWAALGALALLRFARRRA